MHPEHAVLLAELRAAARPATDRFDPRSYLGTDHACLRVPVPPRRRIARTWAKGHKADSPEAVLEVVDGLFGGASHEEKTLAALLLEAHRPARLAVSPSRFDAWLGQLAGWAEIDSLCQNIIPPDQMLADWPAWRGLIRRLASDPNINKRRASLVLLTGACGRSPDPRLAALAFETIEALKGERAIILTKAVSWLLRCLVRHHAAEVSTYLDREAASLPAIAVRETRAKLATGRKS
jgi:3-methyladenine DNA glycosylase AlkD